MISGQITTVLASYETQRHTVDSTQRVLKVKEAASTVFIALSCVVQTSQHRVSMTRHEARFSLITRKTKIAVSSNISCHSTPAKRCWTAHFPKNILQPGFSKLANNNCTSDFSIQVQFCSWFGCIRDEVGYGVAGMELNAQSFVINHRMRRDTPRNVCAVAKLMCSE
jgi:hypothetical protein